MGSTVSAWAFGGVPASWQRRCRSRWSPAADEVVVRMVATGVCHTDLLSRELPPELFWH